MLTINTMTKPWLAIARCMVVIQRLGGTPKDLQEIVGITDEALDAMCAGHEAEILRVGQIMKGAAKGVQAAPKAKQRTRKRIVKHRPRKG